MKKSIFDMKMEDKKFKKTYEKVVRGSGNVFKDIGCKNPEKLLKEANEKFDTEKWLNSLSLCPHCFCMTYTVKGQCGKCKKKKEKQK